MTTKSVATLVSFGLGGLKLWEGSNDLIKALRSDIKSELISFGGKRILEVGITFFRWFCDLLYSLSVWYKTVYYLLNRLTQTRLEELVPFDIQLNKRIYSKLGFVWIDLFEVIYLHKHLWDCLGELMEIRYDMAIGCF